LNETDFLTSACALERMLIDVRPANSVNGIAMFTDGVEWAAVKYQERAAHAPFFNPLFRHAADRAATPADLHEFLASPRFCEQTDDDKTLVLAVRV
jgi:Protein phosphatase 2C